MGSRSAGFVEHLVVSIVVAIEDFVAVMTLMHDDQARRLLSSMPCIRAVDSCFLLMDVIA